jgi:hypothetical protein
MFLRKKKAIGTGTRNKHTFANVIKSYFIFFCRHTKIEMLSHHTSQQNKEK